jgi:hypothetical protein
MQVKTMVLAATLSVAPGLPHPQFDFKLAGRAVQGHSFAAQAFASFHGFYPQDNPTGMKPETTMFVVRTGWNF